MTTSSLRSLLFRVRNTNTRLQAANRISGAITIKSNNITAKMVLNKTASTDESYEFVFPYAPIDIEYNNLSAEWTEIARPGRTPLVDYSQNKLLQVSFRFLVARPFDGLVDSVDSDLQTLRYIASSQRTVSFFGMDGMLTNPFQIPGQPTRSSAGFFFHVTEFSIRSVRRNKDNKITAAECSITLTEVNDPAISVVSFPQIAYPPVLPAKKKPPAPPATPPSGNEELSTDQRLNAARNRNGLDALYGNPPSLSPEERRIINNRRR